MEIPIRDHAIRYSPQSQQISSPQRSVGKEDGACVLDIAIGAAKGAADRVFVREAHFEKLTIFISILLQRIFLVY